MPRYVYTCLSCEKSTRRKYRKQLIKSEGRASVIPDDLLEQFVLFETSHSMSPTPEELQEALKCPRCQGTDCERSYHDTKVHSYIRGYGFLDKAGAHRDMNKFHLTEKDAETGKPLDPYLEYRVPGETDHIKAKLEKAGRHDPKTIYSVPTQEMEKAVDKAVNTKSTKNE